MAFIPPTVPIFVPLAGAAIAASHSGSIATPPTWLIVIYLLGMLPSLVFVTLIEYRHARFSPILSAREDLGFAVGLGVIAALIWPVGVLFSLFLTGFAEGGVLTQRREKRDKG